MYCQYWERILTAASNIKTEPLVCPRYGFYHIDKLTNIGTLLTPIPQPAAVEPESIAYGAKWCEVWLGDNPVLKVNLSREEVKKHVQHASEWIGSRKAGNKSNDVALLIDLTGYSVTSK